VTLSGLPAAWWGLVKQVATSWLDDYVPSMGAALAYYTMFSLAPLLLIVVSVAGLVFGEDAARGEIQAQLKDLMGESGAGAVQGLLASVREPAEGLTATAVGLVLLFVGATTVFAELQDALDRIWRVPGRLRKSGWLTLVRARLMAFGMILAVGFLLIVSLVTSAILDALGPTAGSALWQLAGRGGGRERHRRLSARGLHVRSDLQGHAAPAHPGGRRLARRLACGPAVYGGQGRHRCLHRPQRRGIGLWCGRLTGGRAAVGVLFGADPLGGRRVYLRLRPDLRIPKAAAAGA
jgi:hypothetical protein